MNFHKKTQTVLGISVAAVLAVSLFSLIGVEQTFADDDDRDTKSLKNFLKKFKNNEPHFKTKLTSANTVPFVDNDFSGNAKAWLIYDDGDENYAAVMDPNTRQGGDSVALTKVDPLTGKVPLAELCEGNIYANVHGTLTDDEGNAIGADPGSLRGNLEATDRGEKICKILDKLGVI